MGKILKEVEEMKMIQVTAETHELMKKGAAKVKMSMKDYVNYCAISCAKDGSKVKPLDYEK